MCRWYNRGQGRDTKDDGKMNKKEETMKGEQRENDKKNRREQGRITGGEEIDGMCG